MGVLLLSNEVIKCLNTNLRPEQSIIRLDKTRLVGYPEHINDRRHSLRISQSTNNNK